MMVTVTATVKTPWSADEEREGRGGAADGGSQTLPLRGPGTTRITRREEMAKAHATTTGTAAMEEDTKEAKEAEEEGATTAAPPPSAATSASATR